LRPKQSRRPDKGARRKTYQLEVAKLRRGKAAAKPPDPAAEARRNQPSETEEI
jgi:hypothetical protein